MPIVNGQWVPPTNAQFQAQFFRDFPYAALDDQNNFDLVLQQDITNASNEAASTYNAGIFGNNADLFFYYLWAHYLCINLNNASKGISAPAQFAIENSSVGSVSLSNQIAEYFKEDPIMSGLMATGYGKKYLDFVYPYTIGSGITLIPGCTTSA